MEEQGATEATCALSLPSTGMTLARTDALRLFIAFLASRTCHTKRMACVALGDSPDFTAARTAHPGSASCRQSRNRHCSASCSTSTNAASMPASESHKARPRTPGISTTLPAPGIDRFARNRRVAPLAIALANSSRCLHITSDQQVHQARFADAAFSQQHGDAAFRNQGAHPLSSTESSAETTRTGVPWAIFSTKSRA